MSDSPDKSFDTFLCSYRYKGQLCGFDIIARDFEDAEARLAAIHFNGKVDGRLKAVIPASTPASGLIVRMLVWWRNSCQRS